MAAITLYEGHRPLLKDGFEHPCYRPPDLRVLGVFNQDKRLLPNSRGGRTRSQVTLESLDKL